MKKILVNNSLLLLLNENMNGVKFESPNTHKLFKVLNKLVAFSHTSISWLFLNFFLKRNTIKRVR